MDGVIVAAASIFYLTAAILILMRTVKRQPAQFVEYATATAACALHLIVLVQAVAGNDGQDMSMTNVLSLVAWLITISMLVSIRLIPNTFLMPGVYLFSALSVMAANLIPDHYIVRVAFSPGMISHITLSLLAYGCLSIAFLYAVQMLFITSRLKHKGAALLHSPLPPLMLVESVLFKLTLAGSSLLLIALVTGFVFVDSMLSTQYAHKTVLSLAALGTYTLLLTGQHFWGWRSKQIVTLTSIGLVLLTLAYFGSRFVREVLL
jgi:ABC-type uncharacterized transport system permease subunit